MILLNFLTESGNKTIFSKPKSNYGIHKCLSLITFRFRKYRFITRFW